MQKKLLYHKKKQRKIIRQMAVPLVAVFCCGIGSTDALTAPPPPSSPCGSGRILPAKTWLMTALSCDPASPTDFVSQYGDDLGGTYGTDWISFQWDPAPAAQNYVEQSGTDSPILGMGNWLYSYKAGTLLLKGTATPTVPCSDYGISLLGKCFAVDLTPSSGSNLWQMVGNPFPYPVSWKDVRVAFSGGQFSPPSLAATQNLMAKEFWRWNGNSYQSKDDSTPGAIGVLQPQESVWVRIKSGSSSLNAGDFKLLIPAAHEPTPPVRALNDTGITWSGNYAAGNNDTCVASTTPDGDNVVAAQDCSYGRDTTHNDNSDSDGHAGFSYTKLDSNGEPLPDQTVDYATTPWACVRDNVTGLIWEVKTDNTPGDLHDKDDTYTWYNTDSTKNGGANGEENASGNTCFGYAGGDSTTYCNTEAYVNRVNTAGLCGVKDWRMPTIRELDSLINYGHYKPAIDISYFPNAVSFYVWSGSPFANNSEGAWDIGFGYGYSHPDYRGKSRAVRLVRGGQ